MPAGSVLDRFLESLLAGDRQACRQVVQQQLETSPDAFQVYDGLLWPAMERVEKLYRKDRINLATEHMATRINRSLADQLQAALTRKESNGKRILIACADGEPEELGAQMAADLFEANGWDVYFVGGGVPHDEILQLVGVLRPSILMVYGTQPQGVPGVRRLVDLIREIGANPTMNIMVSGGVFNRADGLWKEVNADLYARTVRQALVLADHAQPRSPEIRMPGAPKKRRRRRRPPLLVAPEA
jgi:methanogenic corrinoid protein MtbC1